LSKKKFVWSYFTLLVLFTFLFNFELYASQEVDLRGESKEISLCKAQVQSGQTYTCIVPAGPYLLYNSGIRVEAGDYVKITYTGHVNGARGCDGANKWVGEGGWEYLPSFLQGRQLSCPNANFMDLVIHYLDIKKSKILLSCLAKSHTAPLDGYLVFGPNEPYQGKDRYSSEDNQGKWDVNVEITSASPATFSKQQLNVDSLKNILAKQIADSLNKTTNRQQSTIVKIYPFIIPIILMIFVGIFYLFYKKNLWNARLLKKGSLMLFEGYSLNKEESEINSLLRLHGNPIVPMNAFRSYLTKRQYLQSEERVREFIKLMQIVMDFIKTATDLKYTREKAEWENKVTISDFEAKDETLKQSKETVKFAGDADRAEQEARKAKAKAEARKYTAEAERAEAETYKVTISNIKEIIDIHASKQNKKIEEVMSKIEQELKKKDPTEKFKGDVENFYKLREYIKTKFKDDENFANDLIDNLKKHIFEGEE